MSNAARRRALLASTAALLVVGVSAACASERMLPQDPPIADPGYASPSQEESPVPTETPLPTAPGGSPDDGEAPTTPPEETPDPTPSATPDETPTADEPDPDPTHHPEPVAFVPECGADLVVPRTSGELSIGLGSGAPRTLGPDDWYATTAIARNLTGATLPGMRLFTSVTIARDGVVVARWLGGSDTPVAADLPAGGTVDLPVEHSFAATCDEAGATPAPTETPSPPTPGNLPADTASTDVDPDGTGTTDGGSGDNGADGRAPSGPPEMGTPPTDRLPPGEYSILVTLHVVVDGGDPLDPLAPPSVLATTGLVPVTVE